MTKEELQARYGQVWTTDELTNEFDVEGFSLGMVVVRNKQTGQLGSMDFQHMPRFYHSFVPAN